MKKLTLNKETILELSEQEPSQAGEAAITATATGSSRTTVTGATPAADVSRACTITG